MAEYRIILNIGGSAVRQAERLADALQRADKHAKSLSQDLRSVPKVNVPRVSQSGGISGSIGVASLLGKANPWGFAAQMVTTGIKGLFQTIAQATKIGYTGGFMVTNRLKDVLVGQEMGEAIRYVQRRNQLRYSLGARADEAIGYSDQLANAYGLNRATTLGSLNVLTGLRVGGTGKEIDSRTAASIVKVGGLIAQQGGYSYERVMTNFQQLLANSLPSKRDIREMLGQAPVLARYATEEIAKRGLTGTLDMYDYYKSHENILRALGRYEIENPVVSAAFARGRVITAEQDIYNRLAENPSWGMVASNYVGLLEAFGNAINNIISALANSQEVRNSVNGLIALIETLSKNSNWLIDFTAKITEKIEKLFGIRLEDTPREVLTQRQNTVAAAFEISKGSLRTLWRERNAKNLVEDETVNDKAFETWYNNFKTQQLTIGSELYKQVKAPSNYNVTTDIGRTFISKDGTKYSNNIDFENKDALAKLSFLAAKPNSFTARFLLPKGLDAITAPYGFDPKKLEKNYQFMTLSSAAVLDAAQKNLNDVPTLQNDFGANGMSGVDGSSIKDFNKDRRSLEIHFHAPIVEWNSEINTDDPKEIVDAVANNIEGAASRAIQIALLGASQKMSTRWY